MADKFLDRDRKHMKAIALVTDYLEQHGVRCFTIGTETDLKGLYTELADRADPLSRMLRFRPDRIHFKDGQKPMLCEIKSEDARSSNFAVEIDSFHAARLWDTATGQVAVLFVDLGHTPPVCYGVWVKDIPIPHTIFVPNRPGYKATKKRLEEEWPWSMLRIIEWESGSGTPFFLVSKKTLPSIQSFLGGAGAIEKPPEPVQLSFSQRGEI